MNYKEKSIYKIKYLGGNVFDYEITLPTYEDVVQYSKHNKKFTVRCDTPNKQLHLPFWKKPDNSYDGLILFINQCRQFDNSTIIMSNGNSFDEIQDYNFNLQIDHNLYYLDISTDKVPARYMYNDITKLKSYKGKWTSNKIDITVKDIINYCLNLNYINSSNYTYFEGTHYPINVGINSEKFILWEIS